MIKLICLLVTFIFISIASAQTITGTLNFCPGGNTTLTVTGAPASPTFQWQMSTDGGANWSNITGQTGSTYVVTIAASYRVQVNGAPTPQVDIVQNPVPDPDFTFDIAKPCSGTSVQFTPSVVGGTAPFLYFWDFGDASNSNLINPSHAFIPPVSPPCGTGPFNVTLAVLDANGCLKSVTKPITVYQKPDVQINAPSNLCLPGTVSPTATVANCGTSPLTYSWSFPGGNPSTSTSLNPGPVSYTIAGTYTISHTATNECGSTPASNFITVTPVPVLGNPAFTNPSTCTSTNGTITLFGMQTNTTYSVQYTKDGGTPTTISLSTNNSVVATISNLSTGTYTNITVTLNGCTSNAVGPVTLATSTGIPVPTAGSNAPLCAGNTLNLSAGPISAGVTYSWTGPGGFTSNQPNPVLNNATTLLSGTYVVTAFLSGCAPASSSVAVVVNPVPVSLTSGSNSPLCAGTSLNLSSNTTTPGSSFAWTGPNGFTSNLQNPTITNVTTAANGTYSVVATVGSCSTSPVTTNAVVNPTPVIGGGSSDPTGCAVTDGQITLTGLLPATAYIVQYLKNGGPQTLPLTSNNSGVISITNLSGGSYTNITAALNGCTSNAIGPFVLASLTVPAAPTAASNSPLCTGNTLNLTANSTSPGVVYAWTGPGGFTSNQQNPVIPNAAAANSGTYNVTVTLNGCTSAPAVVNAVINQTPATPKAGSNSPLCTGNNLRLNANTNVPSATYIWTGPGGFTSGLQNPVINNITASANGKYFVSANLNGCSSLNDSISITVGNYPVLDLGPDLILPSGSQHIMNPSVLNGPITNYLWSPPANLSCSNCAAPTAAIVSNVAYTLKVTNADGCSATDTIKIDVICDKAQVFIPNAFTPNGDGMNDKFIIRAAGSAVIRSLKIFNKWGELVFEKSNITPNNSVNGWDGKVKGQPGDPDVFIYTAEIICGAGDSFFYRGNILLLK